MRTNADKSSTITATELLAGGWDLRRDPEDGRVYAAKDTRGSGMCYLTPPDPERSWGSHFCEWVHPSWLTPKEFKALPMVSAAEAVKETTPLEAP